MSCVFGFEIHAFLDFEVQNVFQLTCFSCSFPKLQTSRLTKRLDKCSTCLYITTVMKPSFISLIANPTYSVGSYETLIKRYTNHKIVQVAHKGIP